MTSDAEMQTAIAHFNAGHYWDVHEVLERPWAGSHGTRRNWLAGLILLAAALHQQRARHNDHAAGRLYQRGMRRWHGLPEDCGGLRLPDVRREVRQALDDPAYMPHIAWPE